MGETDVMSRLSSKAASIRGNELTQNALSRQQIEEVKQNIENRTSAGEVSVFSQKNNRGLWA